MAHGLCLLWQPWLIALFAGSDMLIFAAYSLIPFAMFKVIRARDDIAHPGLCLLFTACFVFCGLTHLVAVVTLWFPIYVLQGGLKLATGLVSMATVAVLFPLLPRIIALPSATSLSAANERLIEEIAAHEKTLDQLRQARARLEDKVAQRTEALERSNEELNIVLREAGNRAGNLKILMEALAHRTADEATGAEDFFALFQARITAVVEASDALTRRDGSLPEGMRDLAEAQLGAYRAAYAGRFQLSGENLQLSPGAARQLGLALNELVTNAVKHGALRDGAGRVQLNWSVYRDWPTGGARFQLNWLEHLSPAGQAALGQVDLLEGEFPQAGRLGFGSHVLSIAVPRRLNGRADIDFLPEGLSYALDLPLADVACTGGLAPAAAAPQTVASAAAGLTPAAPVPRPARSPVDRVPRSA